ncbi:MAG TPA: alpha/beta fold hydrolase [Chitinophagaceae bacterium]
MERLKNIVLRGAENKPLALDIFYKDKEPQPVVIYAHGFNGFKDWGNFDLVAQRFAEAGLAFVKFNFSHNGTTPEKPEEFVDPEAFGLNNYTRELYDLQIVIGWVVNSAAQEGSPIDPDRIFLVGHSMGGGIVLLKAAEDPRVKGVATWASISECKTPWGSWNAGRLEEWKRTGVQYVTNSRTKQDMPLFYQLYEDYQAHQERLDIKAAVKRLSIPLLICHGTHDEAVSIINAYELHAAAKDAELFEVDSDHVFGRKHPWTGETLPAAMQQVVNKTIEFFKKISGKE